MKVITVCQPWASAIVKGFKEVENRSWKTKYRGPLLIHAGLSKKWMKRPECISLLQDKLDFDSLPMGYLIGGVNVVDCADMQDVFHVHKYSLDKDPFAFGLYCWILRDFYEFKKPIKATGKLRVWEYDDTRLLQEMSM